MKKTIKKIRRQRGFALIEVMLASLILTIGGVAYMKLQQRGLQYNYNNYARTQGLAIAQGLVEQLRGNVGYFGNTRITGKVESSASIEAPVSCSSSSGTVNSTNHTCAESIFKYQMSLISQQMQLVSKDSVLCYLEQPGVNIRGHLRVTYIWKDNSKAGQQVALNCPANFNSVTNQSNAVTIYVQL